MAAKVRAYMYFGVMAAFAVVYFGFSSVLYDHLATVLPACAGEFVENSPAQFTAAPYASALDVSAYFMPTYETVSIASRDPDITLSGWFVPTDDPEAPAVVVVHGLGVGTPDCKRNPRALMIAGMLHRAGYQILLIDLREHGDSTIEDGMWAANTEEHDDVLGAWDWLVNVQQIAPEQIGLVGYSGGTGAVLLAMGEEPDIAAAWLDSVYLDIQTTIRDNLSKNGYPAFFAAGGLFIARLHGDDFYAYTPTQASMYIDGRPIFITHTDGDPALSIEYAHDLVNILTLYGNSPEFWQVHGTTHVRAMFEETREYERRLVEFFDSAL